MKQKRHPNRTKDEGGGTKTGEGVGAAKKSWTPDPEVEDRAGPLEKIC